MKILTILLLLCLRCNISYAQNSGYHPDFGFYERMLDKSTSQYDVGFNKVQKSYTTLMNTVLINKQNVAVFNVYRENTRVQLKDVSRVDFSIDANVSSALSVINQYYTVQSIRDEIQLLNSIKTEISNIKISNPTTFTSSDRYKELTSIFSELQNCKPEEISGLALKHGIF